ncbi:MAG: hypothetical protein WBM07_18345 [Chitinivibrionales bacterium]
MKLHALAILVFVVAVVSCRKNPSPAQKNNGHASTAVLQSRPAYDTAAHNDSLLTTLRELQDSIYSAPQKTDLIASFLHRAFDTVSGCFFVVGKGTNSTDLPEASWDRGRKIAASYDGKRWALYCKTWAQGGKIPFGKPMSGNISYSKTVFEKLIGDTLFQLIMAPTGSIILD